MFPLLEKVFVWLVLAVSASTAVPWLPGTGAVFAVATE